MRVFTDGSCLHNGRPGAKAGYAVWFPDHKDWSTARRVPDSEAQTNQRAELSAIALAVQILEQQGCYDEDIVIYTDSQYSIDCFTTWITGWVSRNWKKSDGNDVLHRDLIEPITNGLARFKSHRFHHVRAHTGGGDDLSMNNDIVDKMARATVEEAKIVQPPAIDALFPGCPLRLMGPPVAQTEVMRWMRDNLSLLDTDIVNKHLLKAFAEIVKARDVTLTKQTLQRTPMLRAERGHLQISHVQVEKIE
jgi:ribonuclease HI